MSSTAAHVPTTLDVGDQIPGIALRDDSGHVVNLAERAADGTVILFFYPRDNGLRCRTQACAIRDSWPLLRKEGIEVFGINNASAESHQRFRERYGLPFPLLVDEDMQLGRAFGFINRWTPPGVSSIERSSVIIDPGGTIRAILRRVKPAAHFDLLRMDLGLRDRAIDEPAARADTVVEPPDAPDDAAGSGEVDLPT